VDSNGRPYSLLKVVAATLRYVKQQALNELSNALPSITAAQVRWVLTVPAIWTDEGKGFMRHAAVEAGLIADKDSASLILALEPEAACLATEQDTRGFLSVNDKFLVLDCGGGTVDITMHKCLSKTPFRLEEIARPEGGDWGSTYVDESFVTFVGEMLGSPALLAQLRKSPHHLDLMKLWEEVKCAASPANADPCNISMAAINEVSAELSEWKLRDAIIKYNAAHPAAHLELRGRSGLRMPAAFVASLFEPTFRFITAKLEELVKKHRFAHVVLVGGFGSSDLLLDRVRQTVNSHSANAACKVVRPLRPAIAVEYGAVLFGFSQTSFASRISRFAYGIAYNHELDTSIPQHQGLAPDRARPAGLAAAAKLTSYRRHHSDRRSKLCEGCVQALCEGGAECGLQLCRHSVRYFLRQSLSPTLTSAIQLVRLVQNAQERQLPGLQV
jgi:molecular chaperone DnaK (HSP70)